MARGSVTGPCRRQRELEGGALPRGRGDLEGASQSRQALLDAEKTEAPQPWLAQYVLDRKPYSIIAEEAVHALGIAPELEVDVGGGSMFGDIGQALLHDAIEGRFDCRRQPSGERAVHVDVQPRALGHPVR
jgi:hypothetical protein